MRTLLSCLLAALGAASFAGCAQTASKPVAASSTPSTAHKVATPTDLAPGEQVDYAGHRCGNPNLHVKTHLCLFPRR